MSYTDWYVIYGEQPTAAKWNQLGSNDAGFRDGTNFLDGAIDVTKLGEHINVGTFTSSASTGNQSITGVGFTPKYVMFFVTYATATGTAMTGYGYMNDAGVQMAYTSGVRITTTNQSGRYLLTNKCFAGITFSTGGVASIAIDAAYVSMDADGFTINNTTAAANTIMYVAMA